ncbi:MAG: fumarate reductase/succinate dehydrogenase flavoprotein subunit, partial [Gemmatimonadaceae bacterium]
NRLGGNSLSDLLVFGKQAGEHAASYADGAAAGKISSDAIDDAAAKALDPFDRAAETSTTEGPYQVQYALQEMMQSLVGIVRREKEMQQALDGLAALRDRAARVSVVGNREFNPGWHTALDLDNLLTVAEAVTRSAIERKESRGGHFRDDYPEKDAKYAAFNILVNRNADGSMQISREPIAEMREDLRQIVEENK